MSEREIVVPEGMLKAASDFINGKEVVSLLRDTLEAALRWLSENPIVPTNMQTAKLMTEADPQALGVDTVKWAVTEWQRRMLLAPEPEVPEGVKDLLWGKGLGHLQSLYILSLGRGFTWNEAIVEAYRRGRESK